MSAANQRTSMRRNACTVRIAMIALGMLVATTALGHSVFVEEYEDFFPAPVPIPVLVEYDAHATDETGNPIPIAIHVPDGSSVRILVRDNIGCEATVGVAQASTFVNVEPATSGAPVVEQEFIVTGNAGAAGQDNLPLVIGWTGDGETIVVDGDEVDCDESHQAHFEVTFGPPRDPEHADDDLVPPEPATTVKPPCGPGIVLPMLLGCCTLAFSRRKRRAS